MAGMLPLSATTLAYGRKATKGLLGVHEMYIAESGDESGLAVLNMDSAKEFHAEPFADYAQARLYWSRLQAAARALPEPDRRVYYGQLCRSTLAFISWRNEGLSFRNQLAGFLHVEPRPASETELQKLQDTIQALLTQMGYRSQSLAQQCTAWEQQTLVPPEDVPRVLDSLLSESWDRANALLQLPDGGGGGIPAPKSDAMRVSPVTGVAYNARCDYLNRTIDLNIEPRLTYSSLKRKDTVCADLAVKLTPHSAFYLRSRATNSVSVQTWPSTRAVQGTMCNSSCENPCTRRVVPQQMSCSVVSTAPLRVSSKALPIRASRCLIGSALTTTACRHSWACTGWAFARGLPGSCTRSSSRAR